LPTSKLEELVGEVGEKKVIVKFVTSARETGMSEGGKSARVEVKKGGLGFKGKGEKKVGGQGGARSSVSIWEITC